MSTLRVSTIQNASSSTANLTLDDKGNATVGGMVSPAYSFKRNRIINGNFAVWQRGTSFSSSGYTSDRWETYYGGTAPTYARVTGPSGFQYAMRITGAASNSFAGLSQKIESVNCTDLVGQPVTISANLKVSSNQTVNWYLFYANSSDNFSALTIISSGTWSVTTTATTFIATVSAASMVSGAANGLFVLIQPASGGAFTSGTIDITGVQLEVGSVATPYERQIYSEQLIQCQRYLPAFQSTGTVSYLPYSGSGASTTAQSGVFIFQVVSRVAPTGLVISSASHFRSDNASGNVAVTAVNFATAGLTSARIEFVSSSGISANVPYGAYANTSSAYLYFTGCEL